MQWLQKGDCAVPTSPLSFPTGTKNCRLQKVGGAESCNFPTDAVNLGTEF